MPLARPILLRCLATNQIQQSGFEENWTEVLAGIANTSDLPVLVQALARMRDGGRQAKLIERLTACPRFVREAALNEVWGARFANDYNDLQLGLAVMAAQTGNREAFIACGQAQDTTSIPAAMPEGSRTIPPPSTWFRDQEKRFVFTAGT